MIDLKKVSLTVGIAVVFALFIYFAIDAIKPAPKYEDFCSYNGAHSYPQPAKFISPETTTCSPVREDPAFAEQCYRSRGSIRYEYNASGCPTKAVCDYCSRDYQEKSDNYNLRVFWVSAFIGIIALIIGMYLPLTVEAIASGFMFGGVLTLIQSTIRVFGALGRYSRVIILGVELIILVWIGIKKVSTFGKQKKEEPHARTQKRLHS